MKDSVPPLVHGPSSAQNHGIHHSLQHSGILSCRTSFVGKCVWAEEAAVDYLNHLLWNDSTLLMSALVTCRLSDP